MSKITVSELVKNWPEDSPGTLAEKFQELIEANQKEGFSLHSFELHRLLGAPGEMNEKIIAVFEREVDQAELPKPT